MQTFNMCSKYWWKASLVYRMEPYRKKKTDKHENPKSSPIIREGSLRGKTDFKPEVKEWQMLSGEDEYEPVFSSLEVVVFRLRQIKPQQLAFGCTTKYSHLVTNFRHEVMQNTTH